MGGLWDAVPEVVTRSLIAVHGSLTSLTSDLAQLMTKFASFESRVSALERVGRAPPPPPPGMTEDVVKKLDEVWESEFGKLRVELVSMRDELSNKIDQAQRLAARAEMMLDAGTEKRSIGMWIWKGFSEDVEDRLVPMRWNVQKRNADSSNFVWSADCDFITLRSPGLYKMELAVFSSENADVEVRVDAVAVYVATAGTARNGDHPAGNVTALSMIEFLALPGDSRLSVVIEKTAAVADAQCHLSLERLS